MRRPDKWSEAFANMRQIARENPRSTLSLALTPVRLGLMVVGVRACTHASAAASFAALVAAALAWAVVEYSVAWAAKDPAAAWVAGEDAADAPGKFGAECEPEERRSYSVICALGDPDLQLLIDECPNDNCQVQGGACIASVIMKLDGIEVGRGPWFELRATEAAQEFLRQGGGAAESLMRFADRQLGTRRPRDVAEIN
jgi:hypothetical protein